ncbi:MAG: TetR family transcriptional regulator [Ignavibacteria bacterium]|jgi:TetR/AcrR family acrAB operon transcriptional repressor
MRRTKEEAETTKNKLLTVGVKVFNEKGYANTRLEDIAKAAGVTRGAIYHHFGNKAELFIEIAVQNKHNMNEIVERYSATVSDDPLIVIKRLLKEVYNKVMFDEFFRGFEELSQKTPFVGELEEAKRYMDDETKNGLKKLIIWIEEGKKANKINKNVNSEVYAINFVLFMIGFLRVLIFNSKQIPLQKHLDDCFEFLLNPLRP